MFKGSKQILEGSSLETHYNFSNIWGLLGSQGKFHKDPIVSFNLRSVCVQPWSLDYRFIKISTDYF